MSSDFSIRPVGAPAATAVATPVSQAVSHAVQTDLPPSQTVTATDTSNDPQQLAATDAFVSHQAYYDRTAAAMVFQVVNRKTDAVVDQFPDEAVLRRRAYFHTLDMQKEDVLRVPPTDRTA
ncbi:MAG: hypothetical protein WA702_10695 [Bradyrhizobium sp.]|jgi:uncharacterized FlaG/YvyC family protein|uniref:hypothetical protein n=1 Tax=Bradyrhizobium sp. TaxID=376 RepID=UPI003C79A511